MSVSMRKNQLDIIIVHAVVCTSNNRLQNLMCYVFAKAKVGIRRDHSQSQSTLASHAFQSKWSIINNSSRSLFQYENALFMQLGIRESSKIANQAMHSTSLSRPKRQKNHQHLGSTLRTRLFTPTSPRADLSYLYSQPSFSPFSHPLRRIRNHKSLQYSNSRRGFFAGIY